MKVLAVCEEMKKGKSDGFDKASCAHDDEEDEKMRARCTTGDEDGIKEGN